MMRSRDESLWLACLEVLLVPHHVNIILPSSPGKNT